MDAWKATIKKHNRRSEHLRTAEETISSRSSEDRNLPFAVDVRHVKTDAKRRCLLLLLRIRSAHRVILGFLWVVPTDTGLFLHGLKLFVKSRTLEVLLKYMERKAMELKITEIA